MNILEILKNPWSPPHDTETDPCAMDVLPAPMPAATANVAAIKPDTDFSIPNRMPTMPSSGDSNITLWQFLLELLLVGEHPHLIQWTNANRDGEFKLLDAEAVARLWGQRKAKPHMNYDKLSRALRYYYDKDIIKKVIGQKFVYRFVSFPEGTNDPANYSMQLCRSIGMKGAMQQMQNKHGDDTMDLKPACHDHFSLIKQEYTADALSLSSISPAHSQSMTPVRFNSGELASLNITGGSATSNDTPSPTDSSCSPNSVSSSSVANHSNHSLTPPGPSRPNSTHSSDQSQTRKRKASPAPLSFMDSYSAHSSNQTVASNSSGFSAAPGSSANGTTTSSSASSSRRQRPDPLNLTATQYLNPTLPIGVISPLDIMSQMSPFVFSQQMQLYALASASMYGPNSPILAAMAASPFRSPLSTPKAPQSAQPVFQFPPVTTAAAMLNSFSNLLSPANLMSAGLNGSMFKFPSELKTPTINAKTQVPVVNNEM